MTAPKHLRWAMLLSTTLASSLSAYAQPDVKGQMKPLWEFGLGAAALSLPDYRGSDESRGYLLPLPYLVYRGEVFKANRDGASARLFDGPRVKLGLNANASLPVSSKRNKAREGMPNLAGSVEIGPALDVHLLESASGEVRLNFRLPVSGGVTLGQGDMSATGWQTAPHLNIDVANVAGWSGWNLGALVGPIYADRRRNAYFYDVAPTYARADRPAYASRGGYAGAQFTTALSKRFDRFWVGAFVRYDTLQGAVFDDSPLVKKKSYLAGGIGISWIIDQSSTLVATED
ncbi:MAG: MipA/OmpV family protein [Aquabacterium sp.]|uniref:MipA/OmpV family protein n=1 Tax=Aquabacterium sp. TaxID=1872578 RepID=UPI00272546A2|nr:MipA/OmpV family protein [Aquabacterium sp.]MDO9006281.1 MipA/OmpV family protein [Aquabacterium sp.]